MPETEALTEEAVIRYLRDGQHGSIMIGRAFDVRHDTDEFAEWFIATYERVMAYANKEGDDGVLQHPSHD